MNKAPAAARRLVKLVINYHGQRHEIARGYVFNLLGGVADVVGVAGTSGTILVPTTDHTISKQTYALRGFQEFAMQRAIGIIDKAMGQPLRGTFLDVGANIGTSTLAALNRFGFDRVIAVEPAPDNLRLLRANIAINGLQDHVTVVPAAASIEAGSMELELSPVNMGDHRVRVTAENGQFEEASRATRTVPVVSLMC